MTWNVMEHAVQELEKIQTTRPKYRLQAEGRDD
jgi:hypothetical protein